MPATRSNIPVMEKWIKDYFKESAFNQCRRQEWPITTGKPMKIHTKPDAIPYCCKKPTVVPLNFRAQAKADRDFPTPRNISEVRAWYGLVNQVAYCFCKTEIMSPFRHLLSPNTPSSGQTRP